MTTSGHTARNPTDRGKLGCKHHVLVDQRGLPLVARIPGAQVHDSRMLIPLVEAIPAVKKLSGFAHKRQGKLHTDRADCSRAYRARLRRRGIAARLACYAVDSRERLGRWHWVVERTVGGFIAFVDRVFITNGRQIFTKPFFRWLVHSSVGGMSRGFVRRSKSTR
ncbi:transposase [Massilia violaceinigra]|uniref:transposase n=1 Tax=Massilia violaceinigra TaxID=2045208 RepID=UPI0012FD26BF